MNHRQTLFVAAYAASGNATDAAIKAGYSKKTAYSNGQRLLKNAEISNALSELSSKTMAQTIATAEERQQFWTDVMNSSDIDMKDRLKASELLGRRQGDFIEKREVTTKIELKNPWNRYG